MKKLNVNVCFLCKTEGTELHNVQTLDFGSNVLQIAKDLDDSELLNLCGDNQDFVALEIKYHDKCMTKLRNRHRASLSHKKKEQDHEANLKRSRALIELFSFIKHEVKDGNFFFRMPELCKMYGSRLTELGVGDIKDVHSTRLAGKILEHFPDASAETQGRMNVIAFKVGIESLLKEALKTRYSDEEAIILSKAASILRKDILSHPIGCYTGTFEKQCQERSIPSSLDFFVSMVISGKNLKNQTHLSQPIKTIFQLFLLNARKKVKDSDHFRHTLQREPPIAMYIALKTRSLLRSRSLVDALFQLGICISYKRITGVDDQVAIASCERFEADNVVVPPHLHKGCYTIGCMDNIDHNPSSNTATSSWHGTAVTMLQFLTDGSIPRPPLKIPPNQSEKKRLPEHYTNINFITTQTAKAQLPVVQTKNTYTPSQSDIKKEGEWIKNILPILDRKLEKGEKVNWASYNSSISPSENQTSTNLVRGGILPPWNEKAASPSMVLHTFEVVKKATKFLNEDQEPVFVVDQQIYCIAKCLQWQFPNLYGEDKFVVLMGGFHIIKTMFDTLGELLEATGWTTVFVESGITSSGVADGFLDCRHVKRTTAAHLVSFAAFHVLKEKAYQKYIAENDYLSKDDWEIMMSEKNPTFFFWNLILKVQGHIFAFVRSNRDKNLSLCVYSMEEFAPWFLALDRYNYGRWFPVHIRDIKSLPPVAKAQFESGNFVASKTNRKFSAMAFDQYHEQKNRDLKGAAGIIGLTDDPAALEKWILAGPENAKQLKDFEEEYLNFDDDEDHLSEHHEDGESHQNRFHDHVSLFVKTVMEFDNPYESEDSELVTIDTHDCKDQTVIDSLRTIESKGKLLYESYVKDRLETPYDPEKKNSIH
jgi:hypothetical protein